MSIQCKRCYWISCKEGHQDGICKDCLNELKIKAIERKLEEAREESSRYKKLLGHNHKDCQDYSKACPACLSDFKQYKLKEQG